MPANKQQHFVPQFYLRNFSPDPARKTINIFNINREKTIFLANLRSQCYKDYFYSKLPEFEIGLGFLEGTTSVILRHIVGTGSIPDNSGTMMQLCMFVVLQHLRTVGAEADTNDMIDRLIKTIYRFQIDNGKLEGFRIKMKGAATINVAMALLLSPICYDMKPVVLINDHKSDFITSDNPVIMVKSIS